MSSEEIITNPAVILDCLREISRSSSPVFLTASNDSQAKVYESHFQSIKPQKHYIILHQVLPGDWRETILPTTALEIRSCMKLGHVRFNGNLAPLEDSGINPYCKLTLPARIYRKQERDYFRVSLAKIPTAANLQMDTGTVLQGKCKDFSMDGTQLALGLEAQVLQIGQIIPQCSIVIEDRLELQYRGKICSLQTVERDILAGIQFLDLTSAQSRQISTALNKIERQNIHS